MNSGRLESYINNLEKNLIQSINQLDFLGVYNCFFFVGYIGWRIVLSYILNLQVFKFYCLGRKGICMI